MLYLCRDFYMIWPQGICQAFISIMRREEKTMLSADRVSGSDIPIRKTPSFVSAAFRQYKANRYLFFMFVPVILYYLIFHYGPMYGVLLAFKKYNFAEGIWGSPWAGLENFREMFRGQYFIRAFVNTLLISTYKLVFGFPAPILLAVLFNEIYNKHFKKIIQTVSYLPYFLSWVVLAGIIKEILSPSVGPIGFIMNAVHLTPINFLADTSWFRGVMVATGIWKSTGWQSIVFLAAISGINTELYEAAIVDGASRLQRIIHVTIPCIFPVITIMFILNTGSIISDDFDQIFNLYNAAVYQVGDVISTYVYRVGLANMEYSYGTAVGLFKNIISLFLVLLTNAIVKRTNEYSLF